MKNNKSQLAFLTALQEKEYQVDSLGRILIEDPEIMDLISGGMGSLSEVPAPFWNGACSNQHC